MISYNNASIDSDVVDFDLKGVEFEITPYCAALKSPSSYSCRNNDYGYVFSDALSNTFVSGSHLNNSKVVPFSKSDEFYERKFVDLIKFPVQLNSYNGLNSQISAEKFPKYSSLKLARNVSAPSFIEHSSIGNERFAEMSSFYLANNHPGYKFNSVKGFTATDTDNFQVWIRDSREVTEKKFQSRNPIPLQQIRFSKIQWDTFLRDAHKIIQVLREFPLKTTVLEIETCFRSVFSTYGCWRSWSLSLIQFVSLFPRTFTVENHTHILKDCIIQLARPGTRTVADKMMEVMGRYALNTGDKGVQYSWRVESRLATSGSIQTLHS